MLSRIKSIATSPLAISMLGILLGLFASFVNQNEFLYHTFIGPMTVSYGYWVIFGSLIAIHSKSIWMAALNCFLFFLFMNSAFYGYAWMTTGILHINYLERWLFVSLFTSVGGAIVYNANKRIWISVAAVALPSSFLLYESFLLLAGLSNDRVVNLNGIHTMVPTNAWYITNDIINVVIYLAFVVYLVHIFPKSKKRLLWLAVLLVAILLSLIIFQSLINGTPQVISY